MTRELQLIGYWLGDEAPGWPDVRAFVDPSWDGHERHAIVQHLRQGTVTRFFTEPSSCRFCGTANGSTEVTDGRFVWPEGLAHYVEDHAVRLPDDVVAAMRDRQRSIARWTYDVDSWRTAAPGCSA